MGLQELNQNLAWAHFDYTCFFIVQGRYEQALIEAKRARELDPLSGGANRWFVYGLLVSRQYDQALEAVKSMLELDPKSPDVHTLLAQVHTRRKKHLEAVNAYQAAIKLGDDSRDTRMFLGVAYAEAGRPDVARKILRRLETGKDYVSPVPLAMLHIAIGEKEQALALLDRAYAAHDQQLIWLGVEGGFDPVRTDLRFTDLLRRVGLGP